MWKNEVGIGSFVENNFHSHGNPICSPFSVGIRSKIIESILHSWKSTIPRKVFTKLIPNMVM